MSDSSNLPVPEKPKNLLGDPDRKLSDQERGFCHAYIVSYNASKAAKQVGLRPKDGRSFLCDPAIRAYVSLLTDEIQVNSIIDSHMVEHELVNEYLPRVKGHKAVPHFDKDLGNILIKKYDAAGHARAIDMMGKRTNDWKQEAAGSGGVTVNIDLTAMGVTPSPIIEGEVEDGQIQEN